MTNLEKILKDPDELKRVLEWLNAEADGSSYGDERIKWINKMEQALRWHEDTIGDMMDALDEIVNRRNAEDSYWDLKELFDERPDMD